MIDLFLQKYETVDFLVSLFMLGGVGFGGFFWFVKERAAYKALKIDMSVQVRLFNRNCFAGDKAFFEEFKDREQLHANDFVEMYEDEHFQEQLCKKETVYYKEIAEIAKKVKTLRTYKRAGIFIAIFAGPILVLAMLGLFRLIF